jgi:hypothetical protein
MFDAEQRALQAQLAYYSVPWVVDRPPPGAGYYLVTVSLDIHDNGERTYSRRIERWDGSAWCTKGAYARVDAWWFMPQAWQPIGGDDS